MAKKSGKSGKKRNLSPKQLRWLHANMDKGNVPAARAKKLKAEGKLSKAVKIKSDAKQEPEKRVPSKTSKEQAKGTEQKVKAAKSKKSKLPVNDDDLNRMTDRSLSLRERAEAEPASGKPKRLGDIHIPPKSSFPKGGDYSKLPDPPESDKIQMWNALGVKYRTDKDRRIELANGDELVRKAGTDHYVDKNGRKLDLDTVTKAAVNIGVITESQVETRAITIKKWREEQRAKEADAKPQTNDKPAAKFDEATPAGRQAKLDQDVQDAVRKKAEANGIKPSEVSGILPPIQVGGREFTPIKMANGEVMLRKDGAFYKPEEVAKLDPVKPAASAKSKPLVSKTTAALEAVTPPKPSSEKYEGARSFKGQGDADAYAVRALGEWDRKQLTGPPLIPEGTPGRSDMYAALSKYKDDGYSEINAVLRGKMPDDNPLVSERIRQMERVFKDHARELPDPVVVHRGLRDEFASQLMSQYRAGKLKPGDVMEDQAYLSTAASPTRTMKGPVQFRIVAPKGKKGIFMGTEFESEILFDRGSRVKITQMTVNKKGQLIIDAEME